MQEILYGLIVAAGGSLLNFFTTKVYNRITGSSRNFIWQKPKEKIVKIDSSLDFAELKRRTKIIVIDDEGSFPILLFQNEGYSIDEWKKINDYGKLESGYYDIIVLDIRGVADHISENDGLGVLESLKTNNPAQIIIAYSQHSFDLSKSKFWELADEKIAKPSDFLKIKSILDNLIRTQFKPERYLDTLHSILKKHHASETDIKTFDIEVARSIKSRILPNWKAKIKIVQNNSELEEQLNTITKTILKFY